MRTFRGRITSLAIAAILVYGILVGGFALFSISRIGGENSEQTLDLICETKYNKMDEYLTTVENSVDEISRYIYDCVSVTDLARAEVIGADGTGYSLGKREWNSKKQKRIDAQIAKKLKNIDAVAHDIAIDTDGVSSYYFKINPELTKKCEGFWYEKTNSYTFEPSKMVDVTKYSSDDVQRVGWYYLPLNRGRPSWVGPYKNSNLDEMVISYIQPLYKGGTFIGVVGMDISYPVLEAHINDLAVLETGYAFLTDEKGVIIYHPDLPVGTLMSNVNTKLEGAQRAGGHVKTIEYEYEGVDKEAACRSLSNGIKLFVTAPVEEIRSGWQQLSLLILLVTVVVLALIIVALRHIMKKMTKPLEELAEASTELSEGNYDFKLTYDGEDELGVLTRSFTTMADKLKVFINDLNSKAYKDSLTSVRNKSAYDMYCQQMNEALKTGSDEDKRFAVAMFDCNNLKEINDNMGHDKGDIYLQTACTLICKVFAHSPVFRVGGDEFICILRNQDLDDRVDLLKLFDERAGTINTFAENEWNKVSIALGISEYDPERDKCVEDVARRADVLMYEHKKILKEIERKNRES